MAVQKWTWNGTNPSSQKPTIGSVAFDATAEQTRRAYQALLSKGPTSDFDRRVWNDLCGKILDLNVEWCSQNYFNSTSPVWVQSVGKKLSANAMNTAVNAIFTNFDRPWESELNRRELRKGDVAKAAYFLWMVDAINKWCELHPLFFAFSDEFWLWMKNTTRLKPALPIFLDNANFKLHIDPNILLRPSIPFSIWLTFDGVNEKQNFVLLPSVPMSSLMNFYKLNISVLARNGIVLEAIPKPLVMRHNTEAFALACRSIEFGVLCDLHMPIEVNAWVCRDLLPLYPCFDARYGSSVGFVLPYALGVETADAMVHQSNARIRKFRSLPIATRYGYFYNGGATFDFDYSKAFDSRSGNVDFDDRFILANLPSASYENTGTFSLPGAATIGIARGTRYAHASSFLLQDSNVFYTAESVPFGGESIIRPKGQHLLAHATSDSRKHIGKIGSRHTATFSHAPADVYGHGGRFKTAYNFAMEFSEEIDFVHTAFGFYVQNNQVKLEEALAKDPAHSGNIADRESIDLVCAETMELHGYGEVQVPYIATLQTNRACLLGGHENVYTDTRVELVTTLNTEIEPKPQEATTRYSVLLDTLQQQKLLADVDFATVERGSLVALHGSVLDAESVVETTSRSALVAKRAGVIAGETSFVASSTANIAKIRPRHISGNPCVVGTDTRAILDLCYPVDDTFGATAHIEVAADAEIAPVRSGAFFNSQISVTTEEEGAVELKPVRYMESKNLVTIETEAEAMLVGIHRVLASEIEEELATDLDGIQAEELDRRFIYETGG